MTTTQSAPSLHDLPDAEPLARRVAARRTPGRKYPLAGHSLSVKQWAAKLGVTQQAIRNAFARYLKAGLSDNEAMRLALICVASRRAQGQRVRLVESGGCWYVLETSETD